MELCMHEKAVFFLPVNKLTVWSPAFLAARHTTVCLDLSLTAFIRVTHHCITVLLKFLPAPLEYLNLLTKMGTGLIFLSLKGHDCFKMLAILPHIPFIPKILLPVQ